MFHIEPLILERRAALVTLERERDETVEELLVRDTGCFEQLRVHACRREAGHRVQLVHDHFAVVGTHEEVDAREALTLACDKRVERAMLTELDRPLRKLPREAAL